MYAMYDPLQDHIYVCMNMCVQVRLHTLAHCNSSITGFRALRNATAAPNLTLLSRAVNLAERVR